MSQTAFLRRLDAMIVNRFAASGLADAAHYYAPGDTIAHACTVLVDRNVRNYGDDGAPVDTPYTRVTFQLAEVAPARGGRVALLDDAAAEVDAYLLAAHITNSDDSFSRWVVEVAHG